MGKALNTSDVLGRGQSKSAQMHALHEATTRGWVQVFDPMNSFGQAVVNDTEGQAERG